MRTLRLHAGIRLLSTTSAINCAGSFVYSTLRKWGVRSILHDAVAEVEELVAAAVKATGMPEDRASWTELTRIEYITIQLYGSNESIRIQVWDSAPYVLPLPNKPDMPIKRGSYPAPKGKVVWAELPLFPQHRQAQPQLLPEQFACDLGVLRRVRDALKGF